jgi:uncharacterized protein
MASRCQMNDLQKKSVDHFKEAIITIASPLKIILFGSAARNELRENSDLDFLVIVDDEGSSRELYRRLNREIRRNGIPLDFIVESKEMFEINSKRAGSVEHEAQTEGVVLYAREVA